MIRNLSELLPIVRERAEVFLNLASLDGYDLIITETYRTHERQAELYAQGRTKPGQIVTNSRPGWSRHESRQAFDVAFPGPEPYSDAHPWHLIGVWAEQAGLEWGGDWKHPDRPHLQCRVGVELPATQKPTEARPTLRRGDSSMEVNQLLKLLLKSHGQDTSHCAGMYFGPRTEATVRSFQEAQGLEVDGIVGPATWAALDQAAKEVGGKV